ncbi:hypothetical protein K6112_00690 [Methylophilales bacterium]|nr:hypothetical protein K6112_00690 [Methylophilales bacterium]
MKKKYETDLWIVGIAKQPLLKFSQKPSKKNIIWVQPDNSYQFFADPFGIWKNNKLYLFVEFLDYREKKGRIDCITFDKNLKKLSTQNVLNEKTHLSYPFLIEDGNKIYMVPESSKSGKTYIYEALNFPTKWKRVKEVIPNTPMIDTSIIKHNSKWWMFYSLPGKNKKALREMNIAYSDRLLGDWKVHDKNPVSNNIELSRPGGKPYISDNLIHLPVQDSSRTYGGQINIIKILELTPKTFKAKKIKSIKPYLHKEFSDGLHTISGCGDMTLIDCKKQDFSSSRKWINWQRKLGRLIPFIRKIKF